MTTVRFFAAAEDAVGAAELQRTEKTLGQLRDALVTEHPELGAILSRCSVLVGGSRVDDDTALTPGTVVDVLPPFAGG